MTAWIRFLLTLLRSLWKPRLRPDEESILDLRVWPTDVDLSYMNHARYLTIMEQGRSDLMLRTGFLQFLLKRRWSALMGSMTVQFRRPLRRFQKFRLRTRLVCWDEKWVYLEHRIERRGELIATGLAKDAILGPHGRMLPANAFAAFGYSMASPPVPLLIERLQQGEQLMYERMEQWLPVEWTVPTPADGAAYLATYRRPPLL